MRKFIITLAVFAIALTPVISGCGLVAASQEKPPEIELIEPVFMETELAGRTQAPTAAPVQMVNTINASDYFYELTSGEKYEMRGVWAATVKNIDMPDGMDGAAFEEWAQKVCGQARSNNMNAIVFQVKPTADALYSSKLAPWSLYIDGKTRGKDPGYDPLEIMLETAHSMGIELHAWINPYRVTMAGEKLEELAADSPAIKNPSWVIGYNNQFYLNPGLPEVRKYLVDCVAEIVENYDIDAVHMDDYFYPYPASGIEFPDSDAFKRYGGGFKNAEDWRRSNVNSLVAEINAKIKEIKPYVQFGVSPFGVWRNIATDPTGSNTKAGVENYDSLYADTRQWLIDGSVDYLVPQIYWSRISEAANYTVLLDWWNEEVKKYAARPVNLYVGTADYKVGTKNDSAWEKTNTEISGQIADNRKKDAVQGQIHYNFSSVAANPMEYFDVVMKEGYGSMALTPPCPWNGAEAAEKPEMVEVEFVKDGLLIKINGGENSAGARKYVIYRFDANAPASYENENIIAVVYNNGKPEYLDKTMEKSKGYNYSVRAVSAAGIESGEAVNSGIVWY